MGSRVMSAGSVELTGSSGRPFGLLSSAVSAERLLGSGVSSVDPLALEGLPEAEMAYPRMIVAIRATMTRDITLGTRTPRRIEELSDASVSPVLSNKTVSDSLGVIISIDKIMMSYTQSTKET